MKKNRIYADTSIYGGVFDDEFTGVTRKFFDEVRKGRHILVVSEIVLQELELAPLKVRQFYADLPAGSVESIEFNDEMADLRDAYITAKVVSRRFRDDAAHVAAATVAKADLIISWNFRHLVKWERIRAFNAVNLRLGYPIMTILSPLEVISYEEGL
jgi:predicted nucleic acid-binding protein